jgi:hypothetical protein
VKGRCHPCAQDVPDLIGHLRVIHKELWASLQRNPAGGIIVYDLTPDDIEWPV